VKAFEVGKTYWTRSIGDSDCIYRITIASRTAKTVTTTEGKTLRPAPTWDKRAECVMPHGRYSMAACISADKEGAGP
jgi:hypothetical protein